MKLNKYGKGGSAKGMSKEELKKQYLKKVEEDIRKKQEKSNRQQFVKGMSYGATAMKDPDKQSEIVKKRIELQNKVELDEALKKASDKFDKSTKYDELLGRSTNPDKYKNGGKVKAKKMYKKGGKLKGKTVTKEMADKEFKKKFEESANFANKFAKYAETGVGPNGMPLSAKKRKEYAQLAKSEKAQSSKMKPNYRYVGTKLPAEDQPVYKRGGKVKKKGGLEGYEKIASSKSSNVIASKKAVHHGKHPNAEYKFTKDKEGNSHMYAKYKKGGKMKKYLKGGQVKLDKNKDGKITGEDFKMLRAKKKK